MEKNVTTQPNNSLKTKNILSMLLFGIFIFLGVGSMEEDVVLRIDSDTREGRILLGEISTLSFKEMTNKYGEPTSFIDLGNYFSGRFDQIKMRKRGTNFWCNPKFRYTPDGKFLSGNWDLENCKIE